MKASLHVVEMDAAGPGFAGQHTDDDEDQQQGRAETQRDEARQDARHHQQGPKQDAEY